MQRLQKSWVELFLPVILILSLTKVGFTADSGGQQPPSILWIVCEDISLHLGAYGDDYAVTPHLDRFAAQAVRYRNAFAPIGVCAPSRSTIITGMYPPSIGTHHMRCEGQLPEGVRLFPEYLRSAGYYCTNNVKTDYNLASTPPSTWDEASNKATYRNRPDGKPFFAIFNLTTTHESQVVLSENNYRRRVSGIPEEQLHDPAKAPIPPYHPDTPEVRKDWARYADMITVMDQQAGQLLKQLEDDGLAENTIVFFYSDHGAGLPRSKRWLYDSSLRVPLIIRFPEKYAHLAPAEPGQWSDRMVNFVDLAPTLLSLADVKEIPSHLQGKAFLGRQVAPVSEYVYGFRDRMDERYDMLRMVRDQRYKYIRNYLPQLPYFQQQHISYMYLMPTMQVWQRLADAGQLSGPPALFMTPRKPVEELYDTQADPHEIHNLASSPEHREILERLRAELRRWQLEIVDLGLLSEADLRTRFGETAPYDAVRKSSTLYPFGQIAAAADLAGLSDLAGQGGDRPLDAMLALLDHSDPAVRWWGATGLAIHGSKIHDSKLQGDDLKKVVDRLQPALNDPQAWVRVAVADALTTLDQDQTAVPVLVAALADENEWVRLQAINVLDRLDLRAAEAEAAIRAALSDSNNYVVRVAEHALKVFEQPE